MQGNSQKYNEFLAEALKQVYAKFSSELEHCKETFNEISVHDLRVSIRRLLAVIFVLKELFDIPYTTQIEKELKKILKVLSPLRDTQVQILLIHKLCYSIPILFYFYNYILKRERKLISKAYNTLKKANIKILEGTIFHLHLYIKNLETHLEIGNFKGIIDKTYSNLSEKIEQIDVSNLDTIHKVRLAFKNFRYTIEVFAEIFNITKKELKLLQNIQDILGTIQDYDMLLIRIDKFLQKKPKHLLRFKRVIKLIQEQQKDNISSFLREITTIRKFYHKIFKNKSYETN